MTWVKVCGLTREEDVLAACAAGADAVGFVLIEASPRALSIEQAARLAVVATKPGILLTKDVDLVKARKLISDTGVDGIQPYGRHARGVASALGADGLLALLPQRPQRVEPAVPAPSVIPLFDAPPGGVLGGSGVIFDWEQLRGRDGDYVLAGGLGPDNVARAIRSLRPWGVDASSRLEEAPGIKDHVKVAAFIEEAKSV